MINRYGEWIYQLNTPEDKKCDFDRVADEIINQYGADYEFETSIENVVAVIFLSLYDEIETLDTFNPEKIMEFVLDSGGIRVFDYYS